MALLLHVNVYTISNRNCVTLYFVYGKTYSQLYFTNCPCFYRYMFYFLIPYLPEIVMRSNDFGMLAATLRGKKGGVRNRSNMSREDLEVFKYSLNSWGMIYS